MSAAPLTGRQVEVDLLDRAIADVGSQGTSVLVTGEAGIGKSTLLRAVAQRALGQGFRLLEATGVESEEGLAFAGLQILLDPIVASADALPTAQRKALGTAFGLEEGPPPEPFLVGLAALNLLGEAASRHPVIITVDDVQWLDGPTQEVLAFLARRVGGDQVVMISAIRTGHHSPLLLAGTDPLELTGLDDVSAREVLAVAAGDLDEGDREGILRQAQGNPLALMELPTAWRTARPAMAQLLPQLVPLSGRLERAFASRLPELPELTRAALLVAAVDAEGELPEILVATSGLCGSEVDGSVFEPAARAGLLTFDQTHVRFRHPLVKSGILQAESTSRRQAASAALADALTHQPLRRTWYRAQATIGPDDEVADALEEAHTENLRRGSVTAAISALERAAQLTSDSARRGHRLLLAAELAYGLGQAALVAKLLRAASQHTLTELDRARMEWLRELPDGTDFKNGRRIAELCDVARQAAAASDVDLALNLLIAAAVRCFWGWPAPEVRQLVVSAAEDLSAAETDPRLLAVLGVAAPLQQGQRVRQLLSRAAIASSVDAEGLALCGMAAHAIGDQPSAADLLRRAEVGCRQDGRMGLLTQVLSLRSAVCIDLGDWREATAAAEEGQRLAGETRQSTWLGGTLADTARIHGLRGDESLALGLAVEVEAAVAPHGNTCLLAAAVLARGFALLTGGRFSEAFEELRRMFDPTEPSCHERERMAGVMYLAEAAVRAGRRTEALAILDQLEVTARNSPSPILSAHLVYARAVLARDEEAEDLYVAALDSDLIRWPVVKARVQLAYGVWLRRQRRATEARGHLRSAQETLEWIGANTWLEQARLELRASGERMTNAEGPDPSQLWQDSLTAQELQIARLAAEGLSNREIGERLFMSHRTVGSHLHHTFVKLGITSRVQLAGLFPVAR